MTYTIDHIYHYIDYINYIIIQYYIIIHHYHIYHVQCRYSYLKYIMYMI